MTAEEVFTLSNTANHTATVPLENAKALFGLLNVSNILEAAETRADAQPDKEVEEDEQQKLEIKGLEFPDAVLDAVARYASLGNVARTTSISRPAPTDLERTVTNEEKKLIEAAKSGDYLTELLNCAVQLRFRELSDLCAAFLALEIDKIAKDAPDIMTGAERIRNFMHMSNEWTKEEMEHLRKEMEYAKSVDPEVY